MLSLQDFGNVMSGIAVRTDGKVLSRIYSGESLSGVAPYLKKYGNIFVVYDEHLRDKTHELADTLPCVRGFFPLNVSEESKNLDTVVSICKWLLETGANRDALLLSLGGGVVSDMAGFAASIYKRGIRFAFIPTTLLAQVDAGIGGKTGVNFMNYKNIIGVIKQPEFTYECSEVLDTLPYRDFVSGTAELLKTFIIDNSKGKYADAVRILAEIFNSEDKQEAIKNNHPELLELISAAAVVKAGVVSRDQFENGERRKLNLGHTFAHAIEWAEHSAGREEFTHGEAVAVGIALAAELSEKIGFCAKGLAEKIRKDLISLGLPTKVSYSLGELEGAMLKDKKAEDGKVHFVLIRDIGDVCIVDLVPGEVMKILEK